MNLAPEFTTAGITGIKTACGTARPSGLTALQETAFSLIIQSLPTNHVITAQSLRNELEGMVRELQAELRSVEDYRPSRRHDKMMHGKLAAFLFTVAHIVDDKYNPGEMNYAEAELNAERIICKLYRLLSPGNLKSTNVSGVTRTAETAEESARMIDSSRVRLWADQDHNNAIRANCDTRTATNDPDFPLPANDSPTANDAPDFRTQVADFLRDVLEVKSGTPDQLLAIAKERHSFVKVRTAPVAIGQEYDM